MNKNDLENLHLVRKYANQKIEKATVLLSILNPISFSKAKDFKEDCLKYPDLKNKVIRQKILNKKALSLI